MRKKLDLEEKLRKLSAERISAGPMFKVKHLADEAGAKPKILSIDELRMPQGLPLNIKDFIRDKERLEETLVLNENPEIELKWTVSEDMYAEEFGSVVKEGFSQVKTNPPTYAYEFEDGGIVTSHLGAYTFILASFNVKAARLAEILEFAISSFKSKIA